MRLHLSFLEFEIARHGVYVRIPRVVSFFVDWTSQGLSSADWGRRSK